MPFARILFAVIFVGLVSVPLLLKPAEQAKQDAASRQLIIITPHLAQLREEFATGFSKWHEKNFGEPIHVRYVTPGGTSEIIKQLTAQYSAAWNAGKIDHESFETAPGTIPIDLMFGGGSYDHGRLMRACRVDRIKPDGSKETLALPMSISAGFPQEQMDEWFGPNAIGAQPLYEKDQHWMGTALSSFGIVYNREVYERLGLEPPTSFDDLTKPELMGWIAMADPRQSGSITTTLDYILSHDGWDKGWRLLRELSANARYFSSSSSKPPIDVSTGEAAAGLAIDFYGRGQAQSVLAPGQDPATGRVGYVDPAGSVYIDPDPVSILRGGPEPELARRFIQYVMSIEGQSVWNFEPKLYQDAPIVDDAGTELGPERYALRRLPVRRIMYEKYFQHFMDKVNPYLIAGDDKPAGWRSSIGPMMGAFGIDNDTEVKRAWKALNRARSDTTFPPDVLAEMERLFYAMPMHMMPDGTELLFTPENYKAIRNSWRDPDHPRWAIKSQIRYVEFFRRSYRKVIALQHDRELNPAGTIQ